jgi:hypothetical protein
VSVDFYYVFGLAGALLLSGPVILLTLVSSRPKGKLTYTAHHPIFRRFRKVAWGLLGSLSIFLGSFVTSSIIYNQFIEQRMWFDGGPPILRIPMGIPFILVGMLWLRRSVD